MGKLSFSHVGGPRQRVAVPKRPDAFRRRRKIAPTSLRYKLPAVFVQAVVERDEEQRASASPVSHGFLNKSPSLSNHSLNSNSSSNLSGCPNCKQLTRDTAGSSLALPRNVLLSDLPVAVLTVAHKLEKAKERRQRRQVAEKVEEVITRITAAYEHYGMQFTLSNEDQDDTCFNPVDFTLGGVDIQQENEKRQERQIVNDIFSTYETRSTSRNEIIKDVDFWFHQTQYDLDQSSSDGDISRTLQEYSSNMAVLNKAFSKMKRNTTKLSVLLNRLFHGREGEQELPDDSALQEDADEVEDGGTGNQANASEGTRKQKLFTIKKVITDKDLSSNPANIKKAAAYTQAVLDEGIRSSINVQTKGVLKSGARQFKILWEFIQMKLEAMSVLEEKVRKNSADVDKKLLEEQKKKDQDKIKALKEENNSLLQNIDELQAQISDYIDQINEQKDKALSLIQNTLPQESSQTVALDVPPPVEKASSHYQEEGEHVQTITEGNPSTLVMNRQPSVIPPTPRASNVLKKPSMQNKPSKLQSHLSVNRAPSDISRTSYDPSNASTSNLSFIKHVGSSNLCCVAGENEAVKALEMQVSMLTEKLFEAEDVISDQQRKLEMMQEGKKVDIPPLPKFQFSSHQAIRKKHSSRRASIDISGLIMMQRKYDKLEEESIELKEEIVAKDDELTAQRQLVERLRVDLQQLAQEKTALEEKQTKEMFKIDKDNMSQQQKIMRMKKEFEKEVQRLREHLVKEQSRFQADLKKTHMEQKKYAVSIHKENMHMMRALNRFKEMVCGLLRREELHEEASEVQKLDDLPIDIYANSSDPASMLNSFSTSAKELLVSLESQLSRALLNKRLAIKDTMIAKQNVQRELDESLDKLQKVKDASVSQEERLFRMNDRNQFLTDRYKELLHTNLMLEKELAPYQEVLEQYQKLKVAMDTVQREKKDAEKEANAQIRELDRHRSDLKKELIEQYSSVRELKSKVHDNKVSSTTHFSRFYLSKRDREHNAYLLKSALEANEINDEMYEKGIAAMNESSSSATERLVQLIEKYIAYRKMTKINAVVTRAGRRTGEDDLKFRKYIDMVEERYYNASMKWEEKKEHFVKQREKAFASLTEVMKEVKENQGLLLVEPAASVIGTCQSNQPCNKNAQSWRDVPRQHHSQPPLLPDFIAGKGVIAGKHGTSMWQMPPTVPTRLVQINTPSLLDMEINPWKKLLGGFNKRKNAKPGTAFLPPIASLYP